MECNKQIPTNDYPTTANLQKQRGGMDFSSDLRTITSGLLRTAEANSSFASKGDAFVSADKQKRMLIGSQVLYIKTSVGDCN
jgi:hypothetical protein